VFGYCYHSVNAISYGLAQSDHNKLHQVYCQVKIFDLPNNIKYLVLFPPLRNSCIMLNQIKGRERERERGREGERERGREGETKDSIKYLLL
jgi:hypothetical protein